MLRANGGTANQQRSSNDGNRESEMLAGSSGEKATHTHIVCFENVAVLYSRFPCAFWPKQFFWADAHRECESKKLNRRVIQQVIWAQWFCELNSQMSWVHTHWILWPHETIWQQTVCSLLWQRIFCCCCFDNGRVLGERENAQDKATTKKPVVVLTLAEMGKQPHDFIQLVHRHFFLLETHSGLSQKQV